MDVPDERGRRRGHDDVRRDLAVGAAVVVGITSLAIALAAVTAPDWVEVGLLVAAVAAAGWFWGRTTGLMAAIAAITWFAVALTDPSFEARIDDPSQVQLTLLLIVVSVLASVAGDLARSYRDGPTT